MIRHTIGLAALWGAGFASLPAWASATGQGASFQLGAFGGGHVFAEGVRLGSPGTGTYTRPGSDALAGLRIGAGLGPWFSAEAEVSGMATVDEPSGRAARILSYRVNALANLRSGTFRPFLLLGAGAMQVTNSAGDGTQGLASDLKAEAHAGVGFDYQIVDAVAVRGDARLVQMPSKERWGLCTDFEATLGATVRFGATTSAPRTQPVVPTRPAPSASPTIPGEAPPPSLPPPPLPGPAPVREASLPAAPPLPARTVSDLLERAREIHFSGSTLKASSNAFLDELAERMAEEPGARLEIGAHVADQGNPKKERQLTERRAAAVKAALVGRGVPADRLVAKGYGAEDPIAPNLTRTGRMRNDRIELHRVAR